MSRPRLLHRRSRRADAPLRAMPGSLAAILPLPLLIGGCVSDEDELQLEPAAPLLLPKTPAAPAELAIPA